MYTYFYVFGVVIGIIIGIVIEEDWEETIGRSLVWPILVATYLTRSCFRALDYSVGVLLGWN